MSQETPNCSFSAFSKHYSHSWADVMGSVWVWPGQSEGMWIGETFLWVWVREGPSFLSLGSQTKILTTAETELQQTFSAGLIFFSVCCLIWHKTWRFYPKPLRCDFVTRVCLIRADSGFTPDGREAKWWNNVQLSANWRTAGSLGMNLRLKLLM